MDSVENSIMHLEKELILVNLMIEDLRKTKSEFPEADIYTAILQKKLSDSYELKAKINVLKAQLKSEPPSVPTSLSSSNESRKSVEEKTVRIIGTFYTLTSFPGFLRIKDDKILPAFSKTVRLTDSLRHNSKCGFCGKDCTNPGGRAAHEKQCDKCKSEAIVAAQKDLSDRPFPSFRSASDSKTEEIEKVENRKRTKGMES